MSRPESDPDYLAGCIDAFLGAMREADAMIANGTTGQELAESWSRSRKRLLSW